jgi:hypothetical protein
MKQVNLDLSLYVKKIRKRKILEQIDRIVPWQALRDLTAPYYLEGHKGHSPLSRATIFADALFAAVAHPVPPHGECVL